ncbi:MAG: HPr(Ser) kinase/phosphatase [Clostridiales bacterium]|nr:HPr(Ser) kinase/phosphatase [Clostridiales bacterium]
MFSVTLAEIIAEFKLVTLTSGADTPEGVITHTDINRPALQLAGFYDYFDSARVQVIGMVEYSYLQKLDQLSRSQTLEKLFQHKIPCMVICRGLKPFPEMLLFGDRYGVPVLSSDWNTAEFMAESIRWLKVQLAPRVTIHGVLVDVYGEGILILGESGIGKSETALELVKRGHRLVADDAVEIKRVSNQTLIGSCPELIRYFIELRGIGIIDVRKMFGVQAIKVTQSIDLVIKLELWDSSRQYDRLGLKEEYMELLGNVVVMNAIPIRPGRNTAIICESAAINHRQKKMGYNAAQALMERHQAQAFQG